MVWHEKDYALEAEEAFGAATKNGWHLGCGYLAQKSLTEAGLTQEGRCHPAAVAAFTHKIEDIMGSLPNLNAPTLSNVMLWTEILAEKNSKN
jgi:hypothetical protein